ncbi:MAG: hypothetical protein IKP68_10965 [Clostridia bacterium]|nr:hypothetical protein [Clostridia bacterium]
MNATDANPFRYCGEYYDKVSGTLYLRARNYNASIGRFTQEDPIRHGGNFYAYCGDNPVNAWDPSGLKAFSYVDVDGNKVEERDNTVYIRTSPVNPEITAIHDTNDSSQKDGTVSGFTSVISGSEFSRKQIGIEVGAARRSYRIRRSLFGVEPWLWNKNVGAGA